MEAFAIESVTLSSHRLAESGKGAQSSDICRVFARDAIARVEITARAALAACSEGDTLRANLALLRRFTKYSPVDSISLRRQIAGRLLEAGRYI